MRHSASEVPAECGSATLIAGTSECCDTTLVVMSGKFPAPPKDLAGKIAAIEACVKAGLRLSHWLSVLVARAREDYATPSEWIADMNRRFGWQPAHIHHMRAIGDLFWRMRHDECYIVTLLDCDIQKLLAISRLPADQVGPFLEKGDVRTQTRDHVRARVAKWLGEKPPAGPVQKGGITSAGALQKHGQMSFMDALFAVAASDTVIDTDMRRQLTASPAPALTTMINGLSLVNVAAAKYDLAERVDPAEIEEAIDELDTVRAALQDRLMRDNKSITRKRD